MLLSKQNSNKIGKLHTQTDMGCPFVLCYAQKSVNSKSYNNTKKSSLLLLAYLMLYLKKNDKVFSLLTNVINNFLFPTIKNKTKKEFNIIYLIILLLKLHCKFLHTNYRLSIIFRCYYYTRKCVKCLKVVDFKYHRHTGCPVNWYSLSNSIPDFSDCPIKKI